MSDICRGDEMEATRDRDQKVRRPRRAASELAAPAGCAASADEWAKVGREAAREAIKATLEGSQGWAQRLQDIARHASETEIAIRKAAQHNDQAHRSADEKGTK